ncbi:DUF5017 domain-containing protein [Filimonas effusa]|uniref:DUF5017 domain-containing protein n=1 Tax=Filimonas effusa TaxID=2508721 RepID=A0A4Q1DBZ3_9BACT|nr:DUF5017 domain-containing protein [Filimonas effusa]RXK86967.1 DUF5017 domain-containing protein [Filimonas effusa]
MLKNYFHIITVISLLAACTKDEVSVPALEITTDKASYKVGDTVRFKFAGNPDNIVFWSGKTGHEYQYRDRTFLEGNKLLLKFNTYQQFGTDKNLTVKVSDNFSEVFDAANIQKATWTDITDKVTLSTGADQTPSGTVNLSDIFDGKKPVTVAFRYVTTELKASQTRWVIRTFNLDNQNAAGTITSIATMANAGWKAFSFSHTPVWSISTAQLLMRGDNLGLDDDWVFAKAVNPNAVAPDKGVAIKNVSGLLDGYAEPYTTPGTYKVTFEISNTSYKNHESALKEVTINVTP